MKLKTSNIKDKLCIYYAEAYDLVIKPRLTDEEDQRKELICNILLLFVIGLVSILDILALISFFREKELYDGISPFFILGVTGGLLCLLRFSRKGYGKHVSCLTVGFLFICCVYIQFLWGSDLPSVILFWCFIIAATSILVSARSALILSLSIGMIGILLETLENFGIYKPMKDWKIEHFGIDDAIAYTIIFLLIVGVSWLSNREIHKSLSRARTSERELQTEKESLENKVQERTKKIHDMQVEKINNMYQLVEFGRISSGLFHDLMTPLNTLSLSVRNIESQREASLLSLDIQKCIRSSQRISDFVNLAKRQMQKDESYVKFSITEEILSVISLLESKAHSGHVQLEYNFQKNIFTYGSPIMFSHIVTNLISNAIDTYRETCPKDESIQKIVQVYTSKKRKYIEVRVKDFGPGIPTQIQPHIFEPFFTTKYELGCGIGLSATKHAVEKYFNGKIKFISKPDKYTLFTISFPNLEGKYASSHKNS